MTEDAGRLPSASSSPLLDLRGTGCPLNYVKTRLRLERTPLGDQVEVLLDLGEPAEQVPRSLRLDGHDVRIIDEPGHCRLVVTRRAAAG